MTTLPDCSICCEPLACNLGSLKCGHVFHCECILQWMAEKQTCPLCKQSVHRSHIRNLFFSASLSGVQCSEKPSLTVADGNNNNDAQVNRLRAETKECRSRLSECTELLKQKDAIISDLNRKNRVLELDQDRHIADLHTCKIQYETLKRSSGNQLAEFQNQVQKLERQLMHMRNEQKIKNTIEEQNKNGSCDISAIKRQLKTMSSDMKLKFLLSQLEYTGDLYSQQQKRAKTLEKELNRLRQENSALQFLDQNRSHNSGLSRRRENDPIGCKRSRNEIRADEIIVLDDDDTVDDEAGSDTLERSCKPSHEEIRRNAVALPTKTDSGALSSTQAASIRLPTGRNQPPISVTLEKPSVNKKSFPRSVLGGMPLGVDRAGASNRSERGSTGTGGTSSTLSLISSSLLKDRFRSSTKMISSAKSQDIRTVFKRKYPGV